MRLTFTALSLAIGLTVSFTWGDEAKAQSASFDAEYSASLSGFRMGKLQLRGASTGVAYTLRGQGRITGLAGVFVDFSGNTLSTGSVTGKGLIPRKHDITYNTARRDIITKMGFSGGSVSRLEVNPPVKPRATRVAVTDGHKANVVDPISALMIRVPGSKNDADAKVCARTMKIFDGRERYDIVLSHAGSEKVKLSDFEGVAVRCTARYKPISGHRTDNDMVNDIAARSDLQVWFVRIPGSDLFIFYRASVPTGYGVLDVRASKLGFGGQTASR